MTGLPASKKQIARMGERLCAGTQTDDDAQLLRATLMAYGQVTQESYAAINDVQWTTTLGASAAVTSRLKTTGTLIEKLRRSPEIKLPYVRDIAGVRVVADVSLTGQDRIASMITDLGLLSDVQLVDRRASPIQGYRALHLHGSVRGMRVEVQIRTLLQAAWANLYEGLGDRWGRFIRYSDAPVKTLEELAELKDDDLTEDRARELIPEVLKFASVKLIGPHEVFEQRLWRNELQAGGIDLDLEPRIRLLSRSPLIVARYPQWAKPAEEITGMINKFGHQFEQILALAANLSASIPPGDDAAI